VLCAAAGTPFKVRGDVFVGRVRAVSVAAAEQGQGAGLGLSHGADFAPTSLMEREWLEAARELNRAGGGKAEAAQTIGQMLGAFASAAVNQVQSVPAETVASAQLGAAVTAVVEEGAAVGVAAPTAVELPAVVDVEARLAPGRHDDAAAAAATATAAGAGAAGDGGGDGGGGAVGHAGADSSGDFGQLEFQDLSKLSRDTRMQGETDSTVTATVRVPAGTTKSHVTCQVTAGGTRLLLRVTTLPEGAQVIRVRVVRVCRHQTRVVLTRHACGPDCGRRRALPGGRGHDVAAGGQQGWLPAADGRAGEAGRSRGADALAEPDAVGIRYAAQPPADSSLAMLSLSPRCLRSTRVPVRAMNQGLSFRTEYASPHGQPRRF
jgi:hypothetical protein